MAINKAIVFVTVLGIICISLMIATEDLAAENLTYCENVQDKTWTDFKEKFEIVCTKENVKEFKKVLKIN